MPTPEQPRRSRSRGLVGDAVARHARRRRHHRDRGGRDRTRDRRRKKKGLGFAAWLSIGWIALVVGLAILAPVLPIDDPQGDHHRDRPPRSVRRRRHRARPPARRRLQRPRHALAPHLGRAHDAAWSPRVAVIIGFVLGGTLGLIGGYFRGKVDVVVSLALDVFLAIPAVILALALVTILRTQPGTKARRARPRGRADPRPRHRVDPGARPHHAREHALVVANASSCSRREAQGAKHRRIIFREVLPNVLPGDVRRSRCSASRSRSSPRARSPSSAPASRPTRPRGAT